MDFITIDGDVSSKVIEKKSRFIGNLIYVTSKDEAEEKIKEIKKKYYDARHNCIAYRVLEEGIVIEKASDDGEPSGTAGAPMLNILKKNNLCNVLIVVTRYFGGILLGTGGLVRCYSQACLDAIEISKKIEMCEGIEFIVKINYDEFENFKYYCGKNDIDIINTEYDEKIVCNIQMKKENKEKFLEDIEKRKVNVLDNKEVYRKYIKKK